MNSAREIVPYFKFNELKCKCGHPDCIGLPPLTREMMSHLDKVSLLRDIIGVPLTNNSFYRCKHHPFYRKDSAHTLCLANDLTPIGRRVEELYILAEAHFFNGLGISLEKQFIHVDSKGGRVARWKYINGQPEYLFIYREQVVV